MAFDDYSTVFSLEEVKFIAGETYTFEFTAVDEDGLPIDLSAADCSFSMGYFGNPEVTVVQKTAVISGTDNNIMTATLETDDTKDLSGKFVQQPIIIDFVGREFRPGQGLVTIYPRVP